MKTPHRLRVFAALAALAALATPAANAAPASRAGDPFAQSRVFAPNGNGQHGARGHGRGGQHLSTGGLVKPVSGRSHAGRHHR